MKIKYTLITILLLLCTQPSFATGFGWYATSMDWRNFSKESKKIEANNALLKSEHSKKDLLKNKQRKIDEWIWEIANCPRQGDQCKFKYKLFTVEESPMDSMEFYWDKAFSYGAHALSKTKLMTDYFSLFKTGRLYIKHTSEFVGSNPYIVLSPREVKAFYYQVREVNKLIGPKEYRSYLLHLEGVLLKTSASDERGLIFFGHD